MEIYQEREVQNEREQVHVFDRENNNPVMDMIAYFLELYKGIPKIVTDKFHRRKLSSYKYQFVGHNASGFDNYIVLNPPRGLIKKSFKAGSAFESDRDIPKNVKYVCSNCHISGSLKSTQKEYNTKPQLLKGEIEHNLIMLSKYKQHETPSKPYLINDVLGLTYVISKHGNCVQKEQVFHIETH